MEDKSRALSLKQAEESGLVADEYAYKNLPSEFKGVLVYKVWGKKNNLKLFFKTEDHEKYVLSTFFPKYGPKKMPDFDLSKRDIQPGMKFQIKTEINKNGNTNFLEATLLED